MLFSLAHAVAGEMERGSTPSQRAVEAGAPQEAVRSPPLAAFLGVWQVCAETAQGCVFSKTWLSFAWSLPRRANL